MSWRMFKCFAVTVLFCVGAGWILGQGLAWSAGDPVCNEEKMSNEQHCDAEFDEDTYCAKRLIGEECTGTPGAAGNPSSGPKWSIECIEGDLNTDHCETEDEAKCLQKYNCVAPSLSCEAGTVYTPEAWWKTTKAISPSCVVGGS